MIGPFVFDISCEQVSFILTLLQGQDEWHKGIRLSQRGDVSVHVSELWTDLDSAKGETQISFRWRPPSGALRPH